MFSPFWLVYYLRLLTITVIWFFDYVAAYSEDTMCVGFARLGSEDQKIVAGTMRQLESVDFGAPLHCLVIVGKTHPVEEEMLDFYRTVWLIVYIFDRSSSTFICRQVFGFKFLSIIVHLLVIQLLNGLSPDLSFYSQVLVLSVAETEGELFFTSIEESSEDILDFFSFLLGCNWRGTSNNTILCNLQIWCGWWKHVV